MTIRWPPVVSVRRIAAVVSARASLLAVSEAMCREALDLLTSEIGGRPRAPKRPRAAELVSAALSFRHGLLGGGCHGLMRCGRRPMGPQEGAYVAHRQRDLVRSVLPRIEADLRVWREMDALHRDGVGVRRDVVRQYQDRRLELFTKSRVTV